MIAGEIKQIFSGMTGMIKVSRLDQRDGRKGGNTAREACAEAADGNRRWKKLPGRSGLPERKWQCPWKRQREVESLYKNVGNGER